MELQKTSCYRFSRNVIDQFDKLERLRDTRPTFAKDRTLENLKSKEQYMIQRGKLSNVNIQHAVYVQSHSSFSTSTNLPCQCNPSSATSETLPKKEKKKTLAPLSRIHRLVDTIRAIEISVNQAGKRSRCSLRGL